MDRLALVCAFFFLSFHASAQSYFSCSFEEGTLKDFITVDRDGLTPSADMASYGFSVGKGWIAAIPSGETNTAACSTSWYSPAGTADDWLITPSITLPADQADIVLRWRAKASDKRHRDGYAVYLTVGEAISPEEFTSQPILSVEEEESVWTERKVSLAEYQGQTITLAWVNNSTDKSRLYIDDIYVGTDADLFVTIDKGLATARQGTADLPFTITNRGAEAIEEWQVTLITDEGSQTFTYNNSIASGESLSLSIDDALPLQTLVPTEYTLIAEANGKKYAASSSLTSYPKRVVCEDVTGMWCQYCVRGIVELDEIRENYADFIIGLAVHSGDDLQIDDYTIGIQDYIDISGLPAGGIDRRQQCDPGAFISSFQAAIDRETVFSALSLEPVINPATQQIDAKTKIQFADDYHAHTFSLAYVVVEDRIQQPSFYQKNGYADGVAGPMGGWEEKPEVVYGDDLYFDDVVMALATPFNGDATLLPAEIRGGETIDQTLIFTLPDNVYNASNVSIVAMLIDTSSGRIVNAIKAPLTSADAITAVAPDVILHEAARYDLLGRPVGADYKGIVVVKTVEGTSYKIVVK